MKKIGVRSKVDYEVIRPFIYLENVTSLPHFLSGGAGDMYFFSAKEATMKIKRAFKRGETDERINNWMKNQLEVE